MKIKNLFLLAALGLMASATLTSCEDILGHWEKPTPVTPTPSDSTPYSSEDESVPGLLAGKFTINSSGDQVQFSQGNLLAKIASYASNAATASEWKFADSQYSYIGNAAGNNSFAVGSWVDLFSWVGESANNDTYGLITFTSSTQANHGNNTSESLKTDWGKLAISNGGNAANSGWRTLTSAEWTYVFTGRTSVATRYCKATVNGVSGVVLFPDIYTHPDGVTNPASTNTTDAAYTTNSWSSDDWSKMESAGCVFLPAAGYRSGSSVSNAGSGGYYWSSTVYVASDAYRADFNSGSLNPAGSNGRFYGLSVRLVRDVAE